MLCAVVKTIGVIVGTLVFLGLLICCIIWVVDHISFSTIVKFIFGTVLLFFLILIVRKLFIDMYDSCKESNQQTAKKTTTNANQTTKKTQSNTEPVTYSTYTTYSHQNTTSEQFDIKPTKQYPVLDEIQKIISNLTELEKNQDLDKDLFVQFHTLKKQFNSDYQEIVKMLNTLEKIDQFEENYLESFKNYLDVFKKQQQIIYDNIKQQYNDKLNTINEQLQHFN